jgi:hypothetical protein
LAVWFWWGIIASIEQGRGDAKTETVNTKSIAARSHETVRESMNRQEREGRRGNAFGVPALRGALGVLSGSTCLAL